MHFTPDDDNVHIELLMRCSKNFKYILDIVEKDKIAKYLTIFLKMFEAPIKIGVVS